ncbi:MAG: hypothetical protein ACLRHW_20110 [Coprobacillus cateniformis]
MEEKIKCILITCVERELSAQECDDLEAAKIAMRIDYEKVLGEELEEKEKENNKEAEYCEEAYVHGRMM